MNLFKSLLIIAFLFLYACQTGSQIMSDNSVRKGMSKQEFRNKFISSSLKEDPFILGSGNKYNYSNKTEIIWGQSESLFYVFKNVNTPKKCGDWTCSYGNGNYDNYFYSLKDAEDYLNPKKIITKQKKKKPLAVKTISGTEKVEQLEKLIKELEDGRISEEEFNLKKRKLINE